MNELTPTIQDAQPAAPPLPDQGGALPALQPREANPFHDSFTTHTGEKIDVAAGGPFAETLRLLAPEISRSVASSAPEDIAKQAERLTTLGHQGPLPKYAVNINLDNISDPEQLNGVILDVSQALGGGVEAARRGTRSHQETIDAAVKNFREQEGFQFGWKPGEAYNAEDITATRYVLATLRDQTAVLAQEVVAGTSPERMLAFRQKLGQMAAVQLQLHGMAAEAGRALNAFRIKAAPNVLDLVQSGQRDAAAAAPVLSPGAPGSVPPLPASGGAAAPGGAGAPGPGGNPSAQAVSPPAGSANSPSPATAVPGQGMNAQQAAAVAAGNTQQVMQMISAMGGQQNIVQLAQQFLQLPAAGQAAMARASVTPGLSDMLGELFYGFVLSGPSTHVVNVLGNTVTIMNATQERATAAFWGKAFGFVGMNEGVKAGETAALMQGYWGALGDAWRLANFALRHGEAAGPATGYRMPMSTKQVWQMTPAQAQGVVQSGGPTSKVAAPRDPAITGNNVLNGLIVNPANAVTKKLLGKEVMNPYKQGTPGAFGAFTDFISALVDVGGGTIRLPTRMLGASDQFFKTIAYRGEARAQAYRDGVTSGLTGPQLDAFVDQKVNFNMSPFDQKSAEAFAKNVTMSESLVSNFSRGLQMAGGSKFGYLFAPFVRVSTNILDYSTARVAFPVRPSWWRDLTSGDPAARDLAMARATTGAMMWMTAMGAASTMVDADENAPIVVTGAAPTDPKQKAVWRQRGMHEYSVRLGGKTGKWVEYNRLDPAAQMLGIAADSINILSNMDDATAGEYGAALIAAIGNNVVNKNYMQSIAESMEVFTSYDPEQWQKWLQNRAASFAVPNVVNQVVSANDPYLRRTVDIASEIAKRASLSGRLELPTYRDLAGYPLKQEYLFGSRWTGIRAWDGKVDPVADEIARLQMDFSSPTKQMRGVELDEKQLDRYQMLAGHGLKMPANERYMGPMIIGKGRVRIDLSGKGMWEALGELIRQPEYKYATDGADPPGQKVAMIADIQNMYRKAAQQRLISEYPELVKKVVDAESAATDAKGLPEGVANLTKMGKRMTLQRSVDGASRYEVQE